jgi:hypothetical protein
MLRHLDVTTQVLTTLVVCGAVACGSAAPVDVGTDVVAIDATDGSEVSTETPEPVSGQMPENDQFDAFIDSGWERGEVSTYCKRSFQACGGLLAGTWEVEDNCNPQNLERETLREWGEAKMDLDPTACWNGVQALTWNWSGELRFENGDAIDKRQRRQRVDMALSANCLSASFGFAPMESVSTELCDAMQGPTTTCALASGVCRCSDRTVSNGTASGVYGVLGLSVAIGRNPTTRYEYCVDGDRLLWLEKDGDAQRQVVLRRTVDAPPGAMDPVEIPR